MWFYLELGYVGLAWLYGNLQFFPSTNLVLFLLMDKQNCYLALTLIYISSGLFFQEYYFEASSVQCLFQNVYQKSSCSTVGNVPVP